MHSLTAMDALTISAPTRLSVDTRGGFREVALECLERAGKLGAGALTIDLRCTDELDAAGLGLLVMLRKRARERGVATVLAHVPPHVRMLLTATKLAPLFEFER